LDRKTFTKIEDMLDYRNGHELTNMGSSLSEHVITHSKRIHLSGT
jgi:hypothetical protein